MKRSLTIMLTAVFALLLLAACSSGANKEDESKAPSVNVNKEGFPIVDDKIKLTMMAPSVGETPWEEMDVLNEYAEMTNIEFEYETPPMSDFTTKLNLAFASGNVADVLYAAGYSLTPSLEVKYGEQGILLPLEDLIEEYAPNLQKLFEEQPDVKKSITTSDGHIYALPMVDKTSIWYRQPIWYNGKWLEALDVKELPKTTDELYELLKRFKTEDPNGNGKADEIPFTDLEMDGARQWLLGAFGHLAWGIEEMDGEVMYSPIEPGYKEYLTFMNKLYEEKLLDPETFTQSSEQKASKGQNNRLGMFTDYYSYFTTGDKEEDALDDPMFHPLTSSVTDEPLAPLNPGISRGTFAITKNNPNPEATIRWVDHFYSKKGSEFLNIGKEGKVWNWVDKEAGTREYVEMPEGENLEDLRATISPDYGISPPSLKGKFKGFPVTEFDKFIESETNEKLKPYAQVPFPLVYLESDEQKQVSTILADLETYVEQMEAKFITGVEPLSNWDEYVQTVKEMNVDKLIQINQDAYDRWSES